VTVHENDDEAFLRIVNVPARGIGAVAIKNLQEIAEVKKESLLNASKLGDGRGGRNLSEFAALILSMKQATIGLNLPEMMSYIIDKSGLKEHYEKDKKSGSERLENLNELISAVTNFTSESGTNTVTEFLAHAVLESSPIDTEAQELEQTVQLLTIHAAKGLEFKVVFIVGLEDGLFPHENCLEKERDLEEERRLMYVAITRAEEKLYLLRACSRLMWGKRLSAPISRFVNEIPGELISNISGVSTIGSSSLMDFAGSMASDCGIGNIPTDNPETKISRVNISDKDLIIKIGDMVKHAKFGNGKVMQLNIDGKKMTGEIFFIGLGKKMLDLNIAKIEKC
jgi:DNA helicase-2/ATP-dependent DNA helicase PcrA